jgi:hypothetical protein
MPGPVDEVPDPVNDHLALRDRVQARCDRDDAGDELPCAGHTCDAVFGLFSEPAAREAGVLNHLDLAGARVRPPVAVSDRQIIGYR